MLHNMFFLRALRRIEGIDRIDSFRDTSVPTVNKKKANLFWHRAL